MQMPMSTHKSRMEMPLADVASTPRLVIQVDANEGVTSAGGASVSLPASSIVKKEEVMPEGQVRRDGDRT